MKKITTLLIGLFIIANLSAQTKLIAHKSHSGDAHLLSLDGPDNFGLSHEPYTMKMAFKQTDGTVILSEVTFMTFTKESSYFTRENCMNQDSFLHYTHLLKGKIDTLSQHPVWNNPDITVKELQSIYGKDMECIGFEKEKKSKQLDEQNKNGVFFTSDTIPPSNNYTIILIVSLCIVMFFITLFSWKQNQLDLVKHVE